METETSIGEIVEVSEQLIQFVLAIDFPFAKKLSPEQEGWKAMALIPLGKVITIPKRQFIGNHNRVDESIRNCFKALKEDFEQFLNKKKGI